MINGIPILMTDYVGQITALYNVPCSQATPEPKRKALDDMIRKQLYAPHDQLWVK